MVKKQPIEKKSPSEVGGMVSEESLVESIKNVKEGKPLGEVELPNTNVLMLFMIEKLIDINNNLDRIANAFEGAKTVVKDELSTQDEVRPKVTVTTVNLSPTEDTQPQETTEVKVSAPATISHPVVVPVSPRVEEIVKKLEPVKDLIKIDTESSAQFVLVYMDGFKPKPDFAKVARIAGRTGLGGEWVKQGNRSHWKIPKMVAQSTFATEPQTTQRTIDKNDPAGNVKALFTQSLEDLLLFSITDNQVIIKPKTFLGTENFAKVAAIVRAAGGEYKPAGKASHFRVPLN